ncbi:MAG TPA: hypothetical protein VHS58_13525 [Acetobacteraceae bacterium]|jgi:hypothetical protein|nr:hypothetical protein [Acetobacteraceae bacterium]
MIYTAARTTRPEGPSTLKRHSSNRRSETGGKSVTGAAFWALMDRWGVADTDALRLIGGPPLTAKGTRPRFRLTGGQVSVFQQLRTIDRLYSDALGGDIRTWLTDRSEAHFRGGRSALAHMIAAPEGVADVLHLVARQAFRRSVSAAGDGPAVERPDATAKSTGAGRRKR